MMNPASRNNNSQVTYISITSPLGKAKRICVPDQGKQPPPYGSLRVLSAPHTLYHFILSQSTFFNVIFRAYL